MGALPCVPRFFFDIRDGSKFVADEEGMELPDLDAAEREAAEAAAEMGRDKLPGSKLRRIIVEVRDEEGQRLLTATVSLDVVRVKPHPSTRAR